MYLYIDEDGELRQTYITPSDADFQQVEDGTLVIVRMHEGKFQMLTAESSTEDEESEEDGVEVELELEWATDWEEVPQ